jgi:arsenite-transporting ATPase
MVIAEARRTHTYLSLFGYRVDAVVVNRLLPGGVTDPWFARWREVQSSHLAEIDEGFSPLPILRAELAQDEPIGLDTLRGLAREIYAGVDPAEVLHQGDPMSVSRTDDGWVLTLELPFASHHDLDVGRHGDDLLVRVGPYRRSLLLPDSLRRRSITGATLRDGQLRVSFG